MACLFSMMTSSKRSSSSLQAFHHKFVRLEGCREVHEAFFEVEQLDKLLVLHGLVQLVLDGRRPGVDPLKVVEKR
jgi:hypothetical protein